MPAFEADRERKAIEMATETKRRMYSRRIRDHTSKGSLDSNRLLDSITVLKAGCLLRCHSIYSAHCRTSCGMISYSITSCLSI
jgi:hypothetical protein